jgi:hypothetical protein
MTPTHPPTSSAAAYSPPTATFVSYKCVSNGPGYSLTWTVRLTGGSEWTSPTGGGSWLTPGGAIQTDTSGYAATQPGITESPDVPIPFSQVYDLKDYQMKIVTLSPPKTVHCPNP